MANASEVNRNFDNLYTEFNGNINSSNIDAAYSIPSSQVTINDTASYFSSTDLEGVVRESVGVSIKGLKTIHTFPYGACGVSIYAGRIEVNGQLCVNCGTINFTGGNFVNTSCWSNFPFALITSGAPVLTASDIKMVALQDISASNGINGTQEGLYWCGSHRVLAIVNGNSSQYFGEHLQYIDQPTAPFWKLMTESEMSAIGTTGIDMTGVSATNGKVYRVLREFDPNIKSYTYQYWMQIRSDTGVMSQTTPFGAVGALYQTRQVFAYHYDSTLNTMYDLNTKYTAALQLEISGNIKIFVCATSTVAGQNMITFKLGQICPREYNGTF